MHHGWIPAAVIAAALLGGCGGDEHAGHDHGTMEAPKGDLDFSGLTADQAARAKAQGVCPVSGKPLGSMGAPIEVEGAGAKVFLCCEGCLKKFHADPAKYVAKVAPK